ncbi:glycoside hydrolase family 2 protein [Jejuia pallidilutea]|nr:glycoside hydrolase family 2 TIM barrel-domain containing protein [Jejuia pallidilutea]
MQKKPNWQTVTLPHTWNALDVKEVYVGYYRGLGIYKKMLDVSSYDSKKHFFLKFDASATVTDVFVNEKHVYHHKGGYTGFTVDITDFLDFSKENELKISVNNAYDSEVMPLVGDFNIYGGLHRPVSLLIKNPIHFDLSNYGSSGVFISQEKVDAKEADLKIHGSIANKSDISKNLTIESTIWDTTGKKIVSETTSLLGEANKKTVWSQNIRVKNPHLWNGVKNPYRYQFKTFIKEGNKVLDSMVQPIGLRSYKIDVDKGFFLNGAYYDLKGVCYHEAKKDKGSALTKEDYKEDFDIMMDMGVTAIRTAHYPHSPIFYNMCDSLGVVVYTEIPQVGPGGYEGPGFINSKGFKENGKQQLKEMIRQNYNRPSIFFWGLFNELKIRGDDPHDYVKELNMLAKQEDPYRLTIVASNQDNHNNDITDVIGFNKYYGWYGAKYGSTTNQIGEWADTWHKEFPNRAMAISEYGAGASIHHQSDSLVAPAPAGKWHPEQWQTKYHEDYWMQLKERPFIWGKFAWLMFDVAAAHRSEGDTNGLNDKGLVTEDRKTKKDAYYFYKANWNDSPMLYIAERRFKNRIESKTKIKVYTTLDKVKFYLNGKVVGTGKPESGIVISPEVILKKGENTIVVKGQNKSKKFEDQVIWNYN